MQISKHHSQSKGLAIIALVVMVVSAVVPRGTSHVGSLPGPLQPTPVHAAADNGMGLKTLAAKPAAPAPAVTPAPSPQPAETGLPDYPHPQYKYEALSTPSGPLYPTEPFLNRISAPAGWTAATATNTAPTIAVIDTGFALNHEDLRSRWTSARWDFVHNDAGPSAGTDNPNGSAVFHGTMTAGLAGLLNANTKIMPLQALGDDGVGYTDQIAAAVTYAANNGANIISLSLGSTADDPYLHQQIDYAISKGVLVVAAAGNSGCNCLSYPANYPEVVAVGATDSGDNRASFSSYGANLDVMAPGTAGDVCSAFYSANNSTNAYTCSYSGTSFATPLIASLAAVIDQQNPGLTPTALSNAITQGADWVAGMGSSYPSLGYGYGRLDMGRSVRLVGLGLPGGQAVNKQSLSLSSGSLATGPQMTTTCLGSPGASCDVTLVGPSGQTVDLGSKVLDAQYGGAIFSWNAATLGLASGTWTITETETALGQTTSLPSVQLTISP